MEEGNREVVLGVAILVLTLIIILYLISMGFERLYSREPIFSAILVCSDVNSYQAKMQLTMWRYILGGPKKVFVVEDPEAVREISKIIGLEVEDALTIILENGKYKHVFVGIIQSFNPGEVLRDLREWPPSVIVSGERSMPLSSNQLERIREVVKAAVSS